MNIIIFVLTLVVNFQNSISSIWGDDVENQQCIDDTKCDEKGYGHNYLRLALLARHNAYRIRLANGTQKNGNNGDMTFPMASNMSLLTYDCELEKIAFNISKMCLNVTDPKFSRVGSNIATFHLRNTCGYFGRSRDKIASSIGIDVETAAIDLEEDAVTAGLEEDAMTLQFMRSWWSTSLSDAPLVNLTPTYNDSRKIPFLQMANAATTKFGCSFSICNGSSSPFVSFVCQYGEPHVKVGVPIYEEGPPCSDCNKSCVFGSLCNTDNVTVYTESMPLCWNCSTLSCISNIDSDCGERCAGDRPTGDDEVDDDDKCHNDGHNDGDELDDGPENGNDDQSVNENGEK
ncbi:hypothetical protein KIN20_028597 [Parelaphostrongylus tenuis]|uniref:SCP domain-containing protein n=1 Tax=Parelaphostrongylus tenuis TaxID=148309 RepID=A0AAD5R115_PARTN|nr:hypothetical protein KIN20_028597 [Parelaphostrongylus tenuis]